MARELASCAGGVVCFRAVSMVGAAAAAGAHHDAVGEDEDVALAVAGGGVGGIACGCGGGGGVAGLGLGLDVEDAAVVHEAGLAAAPHTQSSDGAGHVVLLRGAIGAYLAFELVGHVGGGERAQLFDKLSASTERGDHLVLDFFELIGHHLLVDVGELPPGQNFLEVRVCDFTAC